LTVTHSYNFNNANDKRVYDCAFRHLIFKKYNQNNQRWPFSEYLDCIILETKVEYVDGNEGC